MERGRVGRREWGWLGRSDGVIEGGDIQGRKEGGWEGGKE